MIKVGFSGSETDLSQSNAEFLVCFLSLSSIDNCCGGPEFLIPIAFRSSNPTC